MHKRITQFQTLRGRPHTRYPIEGVLARLAADFPELIDPECPRAKGHRADIEDLTEWLKIELAPWIAKGKERNAPGSMARIGRLLLDRARNGFPSYTNAKS